MFTRIARLFRQKKQEPESSVLEMEDLGGWLDAEEQSCISRRTEHINHSRDVISRARGDILTLLQTFGAEDTAEPLHPKVEQVNRHNLPQFRRKIETTLDITFSDDDETYYRQIAEMIDGCYKAYRGPGRYLHHIYPDEVKLFRQSMDQIGHELNRLTEIIKTSRIRLGRIATLRDACGRYTSAESEIAKVQEQERDLDQRRADRQAELDLLIRERDQALESPSVREYHEKREIIREEERRTGELFDALDSQVRTALVVWRKALRISQDDRDREKEKLLDQLIQLSVLVHYDDPGFLPLVRATAPAVYAGISSGSIPLRNSFEKSLFSDEEGYISQISSSLQAWLDLRHHYREEEKSLACHPAAETLSSYEHRISEQGKEIRNLEDEIGKIGGKIHHLDREREETAEILIREMKELTGGMFSIQGLKAGGDGES